MSAKQSLDYSNWVRQGLASLPSPNHDKTLKPCSEKPDNNWKRILSKRLDKVSKRMRRKRLGCNVNEHEGSLVKIKNRDGRDVIL